MSYNKKGNAPIMWVVVFSLVVAALAMFQMPLKRSVQSKIRGTTDYIFWQQFGSGTKQYLRDTTSRTFGYNNQDNWQQKTVAKGGQGKTATIDFRVDNNLTWGTNDGSQPQLDVFQYNQWGN